MTLEFHQRTAIEGCVVLKSQFHRDLRGWLTKPYSNGESSPWGLDRGYEINEVFVSRSVQNVFRGLHFQLPPKAVHKIVLCVEGSITDYVLDLRSDSASFGSIEVTDLRGDGDGNLGLSVPIGCAHGFLTRSAFATVVYLQSGEFSPECDSGINLESIRHQLHSFPHDVIRSQRDIDLPRIGDVEHLSTKEWQQGD